MKKRLAFGLFFMLILTGNAYSQRILKNKVLTSQLKGYETYIRHFVAHYKIKEFVVTINHGKRDDFRLHVIVYASDVTSFKPTDFFQFDGFPVLMHDDDGISKNLTDQRTSAIERKYFKTFMWKQDSLTEAGKKLSRKLAKQKPTLQNGRVIGPDTLSANVQIIDTGIYPDIPVIPSVWTIKMSAGKLVSKTISKEYKQQ
ncbi:hypothetical protein [Mucilaginibacter sp. dw_454]|uniref:hypothetical protein n=1 Tax=Mucilaginibacter sp. dw_454 TaxID=2720079 RepID=UPI001BD6AA32|nr:hypothetical protein [Mucilaginibacter sp. dw_454]